MASRLRLYARKPQNARLAAQINREELDLRPNGQGSHAPWSILGMPPRSGRCADEAAECAIERRFGFVSDPPRDLTDTQIAFAQHLASEMHAPIGEILNRRLAD